MELGILGGVGILGYLLNQKNKETTFEKNNGVSPPSVKINAPVCADSYPLYYPKYVQQQQQMLSPVKEQFENSDFIPANDPTSDSLLDLKKRPISDFVHNNMVPFFGRSVKQNMASTGISSGNYTDGVEVNSGFDYTIPNQTLVATYTGMDDTYMNKRETGPFFSPAEQQTGWVYGTPLFRPDKSQYEQSLNNIRNDLKPIESQQIGPGLSLDPTVPASGGFHDFTRILPNNVSDYKANQLENRVIVGKHFSSALPESYPGVGVSKEMNPNQTRAPGIKKNRPNSFWDQARRPTMTSKIGFKTNVDYMIPDYAADSKPNNAAREQISYGLGSIRERANTQNSYGSNSFCVEDDINIGQGPLGSQVPIGDVRSNTWMSMDNNIRSKSDCNSVPILNAARPDLGQGSILTNWYVNETDRGTVNPTTIEQINCNKQGLGSSFWTYDDSANTTRKETTEFAYAGNVSKADTVGTSFWSYDDAPPVTTKETTEFSYAGNVSKADSVGTSFWTYQDEPSVTRKETTEFAFSGAPAKIRIGNMMSRDQYFGLDVDVES